MRTVPFNSAGLLPADNQKSEAVTSAQAVNLKLHDVGKTAGHLHVRAAIMQERPRECVNVFEEVCKDSCPENRQVVY